MNLVLKQIEKAYQAKALLQAIEDDKMQCLLMDLAAEIINTSKAILQANAKDVAALPPNSPKQDRLLLSPARLHAIAESIKNIAKLPNPSGKLLLKKTLPNKLKLKKITTPLGVVGAIFESRPNVLYDVAALCLRSQNCCVLKGSTEAANSNEAAIKIIHKVLKKHGLNISTVTILPTDRSSVEAMFTAQNILDVIIPRGSESLIQFVRKNSLVPVIETGAGVCHIYIHKEADIKKAISISVNAKTSRPSVCNAVDCIVVDKDIASKFLPELAKAFEPFGIKLFADAASFKILKNYPSLFQATEEDFGKEYLSLQCAIVQVSGFEKALQHIQKFSTRHSEAIISNNKTVCKQFIDAVDAAAVYTNASTRFTDGEVFGLGAEIGVSTQKLHARGPFALEKLVTEKWLIEGSGQVRE